MSNPSFPDPRDQRPTRTPTQNRGRHAALSATVPQAAATEVAPPRATPPPAPPRATTPRPVPPLRQAMTRVTGALPRLTESPPARRWNRLSTRTRIIGAAAAGVVVVAAVLAVVLSSSSGGQPGGTQAAGLNGTAGNGAAGAAGSATGHGGGANAGNTNGSKLPAPSVTLSANGGPNIPKPIYPGNPKAAGAWYSGSGGKALTRVNNQAGSALMAHGAGQYREMRAVCDTLTGAVSTAQAAPPIPDAAMQRVYAKALTSFNTGAAGCLNAISQHQDGVEDTVTHVDAAEMKTVVVQLNTGMTDLYEATEALRAPAGTK